MKIKHLSIYAGADGCFKPGDIREVPDDQGRPLVAGGFAEHIKEYETATAQPEVERAVETSPEPQVRRKRRARR